MTSEYNFNFPPPFGFGPGASAGYGGMPNSHEMGMEMPGMGSGMRGTSDSAGHSMSVRAMTPASSPPEYGGPASALLDPQLMLAMPSLPVSSGGASSSHQPSGGNQSKSLKISTVLSELTTINRCLTHAETLEVQHAQQIRALKVKYAEQLAAAQHQWELQLAATQQAWGADFESLKVVVEKLKNRRVSRVKSGTDEEDIDEELEKDVERMEKSAAAYGDNGLKVCSLNVRLMCTH